MKPGIAVKAFVVHDNKLFIVKRSSHDVQQPGVWEIPGGRLSSGEDPVAGLKRETKEETGIDIEVLCPFHLRHFVRDDKQIITMIIFLCRPLSHKVKLSKEHTGFDWTPVKQSKKKLIDFFHQTVDDFFKLELYRHI